MKGKFSPFWPPLTTPLVATAKNFFLSVYVIGTACFNEWFLFHIITGKHYFLYEFLATHRVSVTAMLLCSLKQVFWKESVFYARYLCNIITILLTPKVQTKASTYHKTLSFCVNVQHFSSWMKLLKLNISLEACFFIKGATKLYFMC